MEILDYHKLKIFKVVADVKSFSKAGELLFLSQPTITHQIKKLENYLGVILFERSKNGIKLTPAGELFYKHVSKILEEYAELEEEISKFKKDFHKNIILGASTTIGEYLIPDFLREFYKNNKNIKISLFIGNSKEVEEGISSKSFYIGLIEDEIKSDKYEKVEFFKDEIILIASKNLDIPNIISVDDFSKYQFVFREEGSGTRNIIEKYLKKFNQSIKPSMEIKSSRAIANIIENSDLLAFVSKLVVQDKLKQGLIKEIKIKEFSIKRNFYCITQKNTLLPNTYKEFLNSLRGFFKREKS
jgi:DNA-binding transcriptional LysR family regulator